MSRATDETHKVTTLQLFFDLGFVYPLTQVTALHAASPNPEGALRSSGAGGRRQTALT